MFNDSVKLYVISKYIKSFYNFILMFQIKLIDSAYTTQDPNALKASYTTMAFVSDGCSEYLKKSYLKQFVTAIKMGLNSSNETVKSAAMYALGEVSQFVQVS